MKHLAMSSGIWLFKKEETGGSMQDWRYRKIKYLGRFYYAIQRVRLCTDVRFR